MDLIIKRIYHLESEFIYNLLKDSDKKYFEYFTPFEINLTSIKTALKESQKDYYWIILTNEKPIGFFMLRGFEKNYKIPSYGVFIHQDYSGKGLLKLSLNFIVSFCKINSINKIMLKVHPNNIIAKNYYEKFGFLKVGEDEKNNNIIYNFSL